MPVLSRRDFIKNGVAAATATASEENGGRKKNREDRAENHIGLSLHHASICAIPRSVGDAFTAATVNHRDYAVH